ncbi:hypothetical protein VTJ04DRAFT_378 [Mycothermus thermophilus]|uniref:uncharacterized protein n=1 Tax=Humicola insolens TaxID=85995 RepID=UPI003743F016
MTAATTTITTYTIMTTAVTTSTATTIITTATTVTTIPHHQLRWIDDVRLFFSLIDWNMHSSRRFFYYKGSGEPGMGAHVQGSKVVEVCHSRISLGYILGVGVISLGKPGSVVGLFFLLLVGGLTITRLWKKGSWFQGGRGLGMGMGMVSGWLAFLGWVQVCCSVLFINHLFLLSFRVWRTGDTWTLGLGDFEYPYLGTYPPSTDQSTFPYIGNGRVGLGWIGLGSALPF